MKKVLTTLSMAAIVLVAALAIGAIAPAATYAQEAQEDESQPSENAEAEATETNNDNTEENYEYIAQPGDSYTKMARKAVQTYGINTGAEIGAAGVLFAETNLTILAGSPTLNEGQAVTISQASVKEWFDKAAALTAEEKANWEYYVPFVDFNTNNVGEAPKN